MADLLTVFKWLSFVHSKKRLQKKVSFQHSHQSINNQKSTINNQKSLIFPTPILRHSHQLWCKLCHDIHQCLLGSHHLVNVFVRHGGFV